MAESSCPRDPSVRAAEHTRRDAGLEDAKTLSCGPPRFHYYFEVLGFRIVAEKLRIISILDLNLTTPPTTVAILFSERHFMSSLFLYHHGNGHELADVGVYYAELDQRAHN